MAELTGLTPDTLRWYEREGLIPPVGRTADGRRRYDAEAVRFVRLIQALRRTGMPIARVRDFVTLGPATPAATARRLELLQRQEDELHRRIAGLHDDLRVIHAKIADYRSLLADGRVCQHPD
ncbi:MerR family transcriptional regulator [Symbioplanes lichenis]|uniref:MerR family transcriptional regulator n=1 Tax=Symbioplanes lichenis TaxID=1629072 RepID=UPI0027393AA0|nr:MerR family transcriptional regulator [Actinoplanes lichenis]